MEELVTCRAALETLARIHAPPPPAPLRTELIQQDARSEPLETELEGIPSPPLPEGLVGRHGMAFKRIVSGTPSTPSSETGPSEASIRRARRAETHLQTLLDEKETENRILHSRLVDRDAELEQMRDAAEAHQTVEERRLLANQEVVLGLEAEVAQLVAQRNLGEARLASAEKRAEQAEVAAIAATEAQLSATWQLSEKSEALLTEAEEGRRARSRDRLAWEAASKQAQQVEEERARLAERCRDLEIQAESQRSVIGRLKGKLDRRRGRLAEEHKEVLGAAEGAQARLVEAQGQIAALEDAAAEAALLHTKAGAQESWYQQHLIEEQEAALLEAACTTSENATLAAELERCRGNLEAARQEEGAQRVMSEAAVRELRAQMERLAEGQAQSAAAALAAECEVQRLEAECAAAQTSATAAARRLAKSEAQAAEAAASKAASNAEAKELRGLVLEVEVAQAAEASRAEEERRQAAQDEAAYEAQLSQLSAQHEVAEAHCHAALKEQQEWHASVVRELEQRHAAALEAAGKQTAERLAYVEQRYEERLAGVEAELNRCAAAAVGPRAEGVRAEKELLALEMQRGRVDDRPRGRLDGGLAVERAEHGAEGGWFTSAGNLAGSPAVSGSSKGGPMGARGPGGALEEIERRHVDEMASRCLALRAMVVELQGEKQALESDVRSLQGEVSRLRDVQHEVQVASQVMVEIEGRCDRLKLAVAEVSRGADTRLRHLEASGDRLEREAQKALTGCEARQRQLEHAQALTDAMLSRGSEAMQAAEGRLTRKIEEHAAKQDAGAAQLEARLLAEEARADGVFAAAQEREREHVDAWQRLKAVEMMMDSAVSEAEQRADREEARADRAEAEHAAAMGAATEKALHSTGVQRELEARLEVAEVGWARSQEQAAAAEGLLERAREQAVLQHAAVTEEAAARELRVTTVAVFAAKWEGTLLRLSRRRLLSALSVWRHGVGRKRQKDDTAIWQERRGRTLRARRLLRAWRQTVAWCMHAAGVWVARGRWRGARRQMAAGFFVWAGAAREWQRKERLCVRNCARRRTRQLLGMLAGWWAAWQRAVMAERGMLSSSRQLRAVKLRHTWREAFGSWWAWSKASRTRGRVLTRTTLRRSDALAGRVLTSWCHRTRRGIAFTARLHKLQRRCQLLVAGAALGGWACHAAWQQRLCGAVRRGLRRGRARLLAEGLRRFAERREAAGAWRSAVAAWALRAARQGAAEALREWEAVAITRRRCSRQLLRLHGRSLETTLKLWSGISWRRRRLGARLAQVRAKKRRHVLFGVLDALAGHAAHCRRQRHMLTSTLKSFRVESDGERLARVTRAWRMRCRLLAGVRRLGRGFKRDLLRHGFESMVQNAAECKHQRYVLSHILKSMREETPEELLARTLEAWRMRCRLLAVWYAGWAGGLSGTFYVTVVRRLGRGFKRDLLRHGFESLARNAAECKHQRYVLSHILKSMRDETPEERLARTLEAWRMRCRLLAVVRRLGRGFKRDLLRHGFESLARNAAECKHQRYVLSHILKSMREETPEERLARTLEAWRMRSQVLTVVRRLGRGFERDLLRHGFESLARNASKCKHEKRFLVHILKSMREETREERLARTLEAWRMRCRVLTVVRRLGRGFERDLLRHGFESLARNASKCKHEKRFLVYILKSMREETPEELLARTLQAWRQRHQVLAVVRRLGLGFERDLLRHAFKSMARNAAECSRLRRLGVKFLSRLQVESEEERMVRMLRNWRRQTRVLTMVKWMARGFENSLLRQSLAALRQHATDRHKQRGAISSVLRLIRIPTSTEVATMLLRGWRRRCHVLAAARRLTRRFEHEVLREWVARLARHAAECQHVADLVAYTLRPMRASSSEDRVKRLFGAWRGRAQVMAAARHMARGHDCGLLCSALHRMARHVAHCKRQQRFLTHILRMILRMVPLETAAASAVRLLRGWQGRCILLASARRLSLRRASGALRHALWQLIRHVEETRRQRRFITQTLKKMLVETVGGHMAQLLRAWRERARLRAAVQRLCRGFEHDLLHRGVACLRRHLEDCRHQRLLLTHILKSMRAESEGERVQRMLHGWRQRTRLLAVVRRRSGGFVQDLARAALAVWHHNVQHVDQKLRGQFELIARRHWDVRSLRAWRTVVVRRLCSEALVGVARRRGRGRHIVRVWAGYSAAARGRRTVLVLRALHRRCATRGAVSRVWCALARRRQWATALVARSQRCRVARMRRGVLQQWKEATAAAVALSRRGLLLQRRRRHQCLIAAVARCLGVARQRQMALAGAARVDAAHRPRLLRSRGRRTLQAWHLQAEHRARRRQAGVLHDCRRGSARLGSSLCAWAAVLARGVRMRRLGRRLLLYRRRRVLATGLTAWRETVRHQRWVRLTLERRSRQLGRAELCRCLRGLRAWGAQQAMMRGLLNRQVLLKSAHRLRLAWRMWCEYPAYWRLVCQVATTRRVLGAWQKHARHLRQLTLIEVDPLLAATHRFALVQAIEHLLCVPKRGRLVGALEGPVTTADDDPGDRRFTLWRLLQEVAGRFSRMLQPGPAVLEALARQVQTTLAEDLLVAGDDGQSGAVEVQSPGALGATARAGPRLWQEVCLELPSLSKPPPWSAAEALYEHWASRTSENDAGDDMKGEEQQESEHNPYTHLRLRSMPRASEESRADQDSSGGGPIALASPFRFALASNSRNGSPSAGALPLQTQSPRAPASPRVSLLQHVQTAAASIPPPQPSPSPQVPHDPPQQLPPSQSVLSPFLQTSPPPQHQSQPQPHQGRLLQGPAGHEAAPPTSTPPAPTSPLSPLASPPAPAATPDTALAATSVLLPEQAWPPASSLLSAETQPDTGSVPPPVLVVDPPAEAPVAPAPAIPAAPTATRDPTRQSRLDLVPPGSPLPRANGGVSTTRDEATFQPANNHADMPQATPAADVEHAVPAPSPLAMLTPLTAGRVGMGFGEEALSKSELSTAAVTSTDLPSQFQRANPSAFSRSLTSQDTWAHPIPPLQPAIDSVSLPQAFVDTEPHHNTPSTGMHVRSTGWQQSTAPFQESEEHAQFQPHSPLIQPHLAHNYAGAGPLPSTHQHPLVNTVLQILNNRAGSNQFQ
ncbi:hypothetical protein CYMTET_39395 [Cymbomonas tetramitiformis]|uniref:Uncharacterized protein n=1 Tax=Cymbomonas tetramitiformis TaxID=36881 RepID=A0AAE0F4I8_9CHLO|nr:hypothetical protein CYMTET_39395 [Cymbomonas tetramitiformis]